MTKQKQFSSLVASIESGACNEIHLDLGDLNLRSQDLIDLFEAINSSKAVSFKLHLISIDLSNKKKTKKNIFAKIVIENLPALQSLNIEGTGPEFGAQTLSLRNLPKLEVLNAQQNNIIKFDCEYLPAIRYIDLSSNRLSDFNAAQFPQIETLKIAKNNILRLDLAGLLHLKDCDILDPTPTEDAEEAAPHVLRTVYVGHGTVFSKHLKYNSANFDPITRNILHKLEVKFPRHYIDNAPVLLNEFGAPQLNIYLKDMLNHYRRNRGGIDLKEAATNYMRWLFNPEIKKHTPNKYYHIKVAEGYDLHMLVISQLFMDNVRLRIKDLFDSINRVWESNEKGEFDIFALQEIKKLEKEAIANLSKNMVLRSQMLRLSRIFNAKQDQMKSGQLIEQSIQPNKSDAIDPTLKKKKPMLHRMISNKISAVSAMITKKTAKKNSLD